MNYERFVHNSGCNSLRGGPQPARDGWRGPARRGWCSVTPPLSSQWTGSEDWFEWVYVDWYEEKWQEIQLKLEELKSLAEADVSPEEWDCLCVNEFEVNV